MQPVAFRLAPLRIVLWNWKLLWPLVKPCSLSTDGRTSSSTAGKSSANLSRDAIAKAKILLEKRRELVDKVKRLPLLNKSIKSTSKSSPHTRVPSSTTTPAVSAGTSSASALPHAGLLSIQNIEAVKRAQELAAQMGFRQDPEFAPSINLFPGQALTYTAVAHKPTKAPALRVDALGRDTDEHGNVISVTKPSNHSTLKVNINKQKKDAFQILKRQLEVDPEENSHFDPRMG